MAAYIITIRKGPIRDAEAMAEYQRRTRAMERDAKLTPRVIYGDLKALEGEAPDGVASAQVTPPSVETSTVETPFANPPG